MTAFVCTELALIHIGGDPISVGDVPQGIGCKTWEAVTLQVPNTFEVDPAEVALVMAAVVGSAVSVWLIGLVIGSVGRLLRDAMRVPNERED